jgi:hypothetical protein
MMRSLLCAFTLLFGLLSCTNGDVDNEQRRLNEEQFISVYEEILLIERYYQSKLGLPNLYKNELEKASEKIFDKHHTTKSNFEKSFEYYARDPQRLHKIQEKIIDRLNKRKL